MSDIALRAENLAKRYLIGRQSAKGDGLRHALERMVRAPGRLLKHGFRSDSSAREEFWALRNINFEVKQSEVVGIIGRNGAGKSTLLKVLSRITEPTRGRIQIRGRVASLLEVGTGFHPELTGRENVYLNGSILGMAKAEIEKKFDSIVAFAEISKFLDTPVKRYSSGMYVRLAFAVAAHLEPEILIVDEVLAVGDAEFQKKCLRKMGDVAHAGRTVLFVSHNMQAVTRLCSRCILLEKGEVKLDGPSHQVATAYLNSGAKSASVREWPDPASAPGTDLLKLRAVRVRSESGATVETVDIRSPVGVEMEYEVLRPGHVLLPHFILRNQDGNTLFVGVDVDDEWRGRRRPPGRYTSTGWIPGNLLAEGMMTVHAAMLSMKPETPHFSVEDAVAFHVVDDLTATDTARGDYSKAMPGLMRPMLRWTTTYTPSDKSRSSAKEGVAETVPLG